MNHLTLLAFLAASFYQFAQSGDTLIWRSIPIKNKMKIALDSGIAELQAIIIKDACKTYHLEKGSFSGTDSITIKTNGRKIIKSACFYYDSIYSFQEHLQSMEESLKTRATITRIEKKTHHCEIAEWRDEYTRFQLIEESDEFGTRIYSMIEDL
jgi:hypothetical protein